jgi:hypothetical protein
MHTLYQLQFRRFFRINSKHPPGEVAARAVPHAVMLLPRSKPESVVFPVNHPCGAESANIN